MPTAAQQSWLSSHERTGCDGNTGMSVAMRQYFSTLYGLQGDEACLHLNPTHNTFYWWFVPDRTSFEVSWIPSYCSGFGNGLMWGPIDDAVMSTRLVQTYDGNADCLLPNGGYTDPPQHTTHDDPCLAELAHGYTSPLVTFPGTFIQRFDYEYLAQHPATSHWRTGIESHKWVEVMRIDRIDLVSHSDTTTCTLGQVWMWLAPGSGIWYNLGNSKKAVTTGEAAGLWYGLPTRPCTTARAEGYDSIQLIEFENGFSFEILDCRGDGLPSFDHSWDIACPPPHLELRSGLPPKDQRWAPALEGLPEAAEGTAACRCDAERWHLNCEGA